MTALGPLSSVALWLGWLIMLSGGVTLALGIVSALLIWPCDWAFKRLKNGTLFLHWIIWYRQKPLIACGPCRGTGETREPCPDDDGFDFVRACKPCKGRGKVAETQRKKGKPRCAFCSKPLWRVEGGDGLICCTPGCTCRSEALEEVIGDGE